MFCAPERRASILLCVALLALGLLHGSWLLCDQRGPGQDQFRYYEMALHLRGDANAVSHGTHPPLYSMLAALVPSSRFHALRWVNLLLAIATLLAARKLARRWMDPVPALGAAFCAAAATLVVSVTHLFYIENLLLPVVLWTLALCCAPGNTLRDGLWLGCALGIGCLSKWTFPLFAAGPFLLWARPSSGTARASAVAVAVLIAAPWYVLHAEELAAFVDQGVLAGSGRLSQSEGLAGAIFYPRALAGSWFGALTLILAGLGLWNLARRHRLHESMLLLTSVLLPLLVFTLIPTKKARHLLPLASVAGLLAWSAVMAAGSASLRRIAAGALLALTAIAAISVSWLPADGTTLGPLWMRPHGDDPGPPRGAPADVRIHQETTQRVRPDAVVLLAFHTPLLRDTDLRGAALEAGSPIRYRLLPLWLSDSDATEPFPLTAPWDPDGSAGPQEAGALWVKGGVVGTRVPSGLPVHRHAALLCNAVLDPDGVLRDQRVLHETTLADGSVARLVDLSAISRDSELWHQLRTPEQPVTPLQQKLQRLSDGFHVRSADEPTLRALVATALEADDRRLALRWIHRGLMAACLSDAAAIRLAADCGVSLPAGATRVQVRETVADLLRSQPR